MCSPRILGAEQREEHSVSLWGRTATDPVYFWDLGHCLSPLGLCPSPNLPDTLQAWSRVAVTQPLQARSPPTRAFDGRRWHRQSPRQ